MQTATTGPGRVDIRGLTKRFGPILAVDNVSFQVEQGEVLGFLGPNGAGKSTTMKMVTGFIAPTSGTATVCGHDVIEQPLAAKEKIGYLPEGAPAYPDMTPEAFLNFVADVRGLSGDHRKKRIGEVVERVHIAGVLRQPIDTLSKGFKRRVGLAQAILHDPQVLIMDEPTDGLDPNQKHEVRGLIREMAPGKVIILSTHILEEVEAVCTRAIVIAKGKVVADGTPESLQSRAKYHNAVRITFRSSGVTATDANAELARLAGVSAVERRVDGVRDGALCFVAVPKRGQSIVAEVGQHARTRGWQVDELHVETGRLDDVFREITNTAKV